MAGLKPLELALMALRFAVARWGWKPVIAGWAASLTLIPVIIHYGF
jgi:hypothetical protein